MQCHTVKHVPFHSGELVNFVAGEMASESNTSFHQEDTLRHAISFQSRAMNSASDVNPMNSSYYGISSSTASVIYCDNSSVVSSSSPTTTAAGNSSGTLLVDSVPGLRHDAGLAVEWNEEEQYKLEEGLVKFKNEPSIMKYIKIAAILRDKTVRDVALRCRWMTRKRRKQEELNLGRKINYRKDKIVESSTKTNLPSSSRPNVAPYSFQHNQMDPNQRLNCQLLSSKAKQLLEHNLQALNQIDNNISCLKLQDNINLFCHARDNINNINHILNNMKDFSFKMRQMQDLPVSVDQNLANSILPRTTL